MFHLTILLATFLSTARAQLHGVDSSTLVSESTYATALSEGFTKAVIRGYREVQHILPLDLRISDRRDFYSHVVLVDRPIRL